MTSREMVEHYQALTASDPIRCCYGSEKALMSGLWRDAQALQAVRRAATLEALKVAFQPAAKAAKAAGDIELLGWLTDAAKKRKKELEAA